MLTRFSLFVATSLVIVSSLPGQTIPENFKTENLVAWCIVPFDAKQRGPAERAEMVKRLGLQRVAYDWRPTHVPQFEEEIKQYQQHGIEYFAFWKWHENMEPLVKQYKVSPQIWHPCQAANQGSDEEKVVDAAQQLLPLVNQARSLGLKLGLYNHGGWNGEPESMVAVCRYLREHHDANHVGIVYNFHHGHDHIANFRTRFELMQPYLLCVNLNGMVDPSEFDRNKNKILPIGRGQHESAMIRTMLELGYDGPVGVLDHRNELDSEISLRQNLEGLQVLMDGLQGVGAGNAR